MKSFNIFRFYMISLLVLLSSCLEEKTSSSASAAADNSSWFEGIKSVKNLGGFPPGLKIEWNESVRPVSGYRVYALIKNTTTNMNEWTNVSDIVPPEVTSYLHSSTDEVIPGQIITYKVKAVDMTGEEDNNNKQLSTVVFDGIQDVKATGKTTATASVSTSIGAFNEIRIYATPLRSGGTKKLVATASGNVSSINITGLMSGVNYKFTANAFISGFNSEDGNEVFRTAQTDSDSFGSGKTDDSSFTYQNVRLIQAFGDAPNVDSLNGPQTRQIKIVWNPFLNSNSQTKYRVIRGSGLSRIDTTTLTACHSSLNTSCVVCTVTGSGPQTCTDTNLAAPPKKYDYVITQIKKDPITNDEWVEELPMTNANDFVVSAHVPSAYMVLVQRDSVNYETCYQMKRQPDPRKKNRCVYQGVGAVPYNSGPGKSPLSFDSGFFDFGYNLLVDRHMLSCNWTRNGCGPNGCIGTTFVDANSDNVPENIGTPSNAIGVEGDVFFAINSTYGPNCFIKSAGSWRQVTSPNTSLSLMSTAATADPGPLGQRHRPTLHNMSPEGAKNLCNSQSSDYGVKRIMRRREYVAASPLPYLPGEPGAYENIRDRWVIQNGNQNNLGQNPTAGIFGCASVQQGENNFLPWATSITGLIDPNNQRAHIRIGAWANSHNQRAEPYFIGATATRNCVSRFGMKDPYVWDGFGIWFADQFTKLTTTETVPIYRGELSDLDDGARDFLGYEFNNTTLGATIPNGSLNTSYFYNSTTSPGQGSFPFYLPHLGIPVFGGTAGQSLFPYSDFFQAGMFAPGHAGVGMTNNVALVRFPWWNSTTLGHFMSSDRGTRSSHTMSVRTATDWYKTWCAVEAE